MFDRDPKTGKTRIRTEILWAVCGFLLGLMLVMRKRPPTSSTDRLT